MICNLIATSRTFTFLFQHRPNFLAVSFPSFRCSGKDVGHGVRWAAFDCGPLRRGFVSWPFLHYTVGEGRGGEQMNRQTAFPGHCGNWMQNVQHFLYADFTIRCEAGKAMLPGSLCRRKEYHMSMHEGQKESLSWYCLTTQTSLCKHLFWELLGIPLEGSIWLIAPAMVSAVHSARGDPGKIPHKDRSIQVDKGLAIQDPSQSSSEGPT